MRYYIVILLAVLLCWCSQAAANPSFVVTGDIEPNTAKGNYFYDSEYNSSLAYHNADSSWFMWDVDADETVLYLITTGIGDANCVSGCWFQTNYPSGEWEATLPATGTPTVTADPFTRTYIRPISHEANTDWTNITSAYDTNEYTYAWTTTRYSRLEVNCNSADQNGLSVKIKAGRYGSDPSVKLEVYYNAAWHTVYEGTLTDNIYEVKDIPGISYPVCIEKIGISFSDENSYGIYIYDVQIHTAWPSAGGVSQPGSYWYNDETAYLVWAKDDVHSQYASTLLYFSIAEGDLNTAAVALEFTPQTGCVNDTECFRIKAIYNDGLTGDMKVDYNDGTDWHNIYDGIAANSLLEVNFTAMPMPVKFRVWPTDMNSTNTQFFIDEFDFGNKYYNRAALPEKAYSPIPSNDANNVSITADLSWTAGSGAASHDVYFGTTSPGATQGNQEGTTYDTNTMGYNAVYYWRIDEKNENGTTTGDVWSFTTEAAVSANQNRGSFFFE